MKKFILIAVMTATATTMAMAQRHERQGREARADRQERMVEALDLTDAQQEEMKALRLAHMKDVKEDQDALRLKRVELQNEATSDNPDKGTIGSLTDDIGALQTRLLKARVSHQMEVRGLLNEDQKIKFDHMHRKMRRGHGRDW